MRANVTRIWQDETSSRGQADPATCRVRHGASCGLRATVPIMYREWLYRRWPSPVAPLPATSIEPRPYRLDHPARGTRWFPAGTLASHPSSAHRLPLHGASITAPVSLPYLFFNHGWLLSLPTAHARHDTSPTTHFNASAVLPISLQVSLRFPCSASWKHGTWIAFWSSICFKISLGCTSPSLAQDPGRSG